MIKKNNLKTRTDLQFVRVHPFYVQLNSQSYFFRVTVVTEAPLNQETGMTVNLEVLDKAILKVFKTSAIKPNDLINYVKEINSKLENELRLKKVKLISCKYNECRGLSFEMIKKEIHFIRSDFAVDKAGDLFQISSHFNATNQLKQLKIKNLKLDLEELIIF